MNHKFGSRLQQVRRERHLFQRDLEDALNLGPGTVSQYERGRREPGFDLMLAIADYLDVSVDYLLGRPAAKPESPLLAAARLRLMAEVAAGQWLDLLPEALRRANQFEGGLFSVERVARRSNVTQTALQSVLDGDQLGLSRREIVRIYADLGLAIVKEDRPSPNGAD